MTTVVELSNVSVKIRNKTILDRISWDIPHGFVGLLGPNGAGKTTLIHTLVDLRKITAGAIEFGDPTSKIGYVPQRSPLPGHMRVFEMLKYSAWLQGVPQGDLEAECDRVLELMGLSQLRRQRCRTLSGGERQRLVIASAIIHRPRVLILDEPTAGLDPHQRLNVRRAIAQLDGIDSVLLVTHLIEDVQHLCDSIAILNRGRLNFTGTVSSLVQYINNQDIAGEYGTAFELAYSKLVEGDFTPPGQPQ